MGGYRLWGSGSLHCHFTSCVFLGKLLNLSETEFLKDNDTYLKRILLRITDTVIYTTHVDVAHDKGSIYGNCYHYYYNPQDVRCWTQIQRDLRNGERQAWQAAI